MEAFINGLLIFVSGVGIICLIALLAITFHMGAEEVEKDRQRQAELQKRQKANELVFDGYSKIELSSITGKILREDKRRANNLHRNVHGRTDNRFAA